MGIFEIISPILILVLLGIALARSRFLGPEFLGELNRLTFWVALPAALFRAAAVSGDPGPETISILSVVLCATLVAAVAGWLASVFLRLPGSSHGTVSQCSFRGNVAYIGLPVLAYAFHGVPDEKDHVATAVVVMAFLTSTYNVLAVIVLQAARQDLSWKALRLAVRSILTNPLLIACVAGLIFNATDKTLPLFLNRSLETLGAAAVPMALLCIGGSIAFIKLGKNIAGMAAAILLKIAFIPIVVFFLGRFMGFDPYAMRIALVFAACPTAAAAYVMACQMDGDESVASGSIVLSTIFSAVSLTLALLVTAG